MASTVKAGGTVPPKGDSVTAAPLTVFSKPGEFYRETSLGQTLLKSLRELVGGGKLTGEVAEKILVYFDVHLSSGLSRATPRLEFRAKDIVGFKELRSKFTFVLDVSEVQLRSIGHIDQVQIPQVTKLRIEAYPSATFFRRKSKKRGGGKSKESSAPKGSVFDVEGVHESSDGNSDDEQ